MSALSSHKLIPHPPDHKDNGNAPIISRRGRFAATKKKNEMVARAEMATIEDRVKRLARQKRAEKERQERERARLDEEWERQEERARQEKEAERRFRLETLNKRGKKKQETRKSTTNDDSRNAQLQVEKFIQQERKKFPQRSQRLQNNRRITGLAGKIEKSKRRKSNKKKRKSNKKKRKSKRN